MVSELRRKIYSPAAVWNKIVRSAETQIPVAINILYAFVLRENLLTPVRRGIVHQNHLERQTIRKAEDTVKALCRYLQCIIVDNNNRYIHHI